MRMWARWDGGGGQRSSDGQIGPFHKRALGTTKLSLHNDCTMLCPWLPSKSGQAGGEGRTHTALSASLPGWELAGKTPKATCLSFQKPAPPEQPGHK